MAITNCRGLLVLLFALGLSLVGSNLGAQGIKVEEPELIDQEPFDLLVLKTGESVKVFPFGFRTQPRDVRENDRLSLVLVRFPERKYEVLWRDVERIDFYEQRIRKQAEERMAKKDFIGAFQNLSFLLNAYPEMEGLESLHREFLLLSAADRLRAGGAAQTLSALESLREMAPSYRESTVSTGLSRSADALILEYQAAGDLTSAKKILARVEKEVDPRLPVVSKWKGRLDTMARAKMQLAKDLMRQGKFREARKAAVDMLGILPDFEEGQNLISEINRIHPMVRVGVMQRSGDLDPSSLVNWPARRAGALVAEPLMRFEKTGSEGGEYDFALGSFRFTDDRRQLFLSLDSDQLQRLDAFGLAQDLLRRAIPGDSLYDSSWAALVESVEVASSTQVVVSLRQPNVLPQALMQWVLRDADGDFTLKSRFIVSSSDERETSFKLADKSGASGVPVEVVEVFYDDPKEAVNDLLRGDIDVLDQVYPADAKRLANDQRLRIGSYSLPSTHMLIPVSDDPFLKSAKFRRALMFATNRQAMLQGEILNSDDERDGRLISGPFPIGDGRNDLLAYAYDPEIPPIDYSPPLARLLIVMAENEVVSAAARKREPEPERRKLIVGCPDYEFARVAVQGMIQQWANIGVEVEMEILPPGRLEKEGVELDLLYVVAALWEPVSDIERLLGSNGVAETDDPYVVQGLEELRNASNWREVREALQKLHQLVDYHLPVMPLWQVKDQFVVNKYVEGIRDEPLSLYENISRWRVNQSQGN